MSKTLNIQDDFSPTSYQQWRELAEADLKGESFQRKLVSHTYEGIDIQPLYTSDDWPSEDDPAGFPGIPPSVRGGQLLPGVQTGWDIRQEHAHPDLKATNRAILDDLNGGVNSLLLRLDYAARVGLDPDDPCASELAGRDGLMTYHVDDFDEALAGVDLSQVGITLEAGAAFSPAAAMLTALWDRRGIDTDARHGAFNADPLAVLARDGLQPILPPTALTMMADLAMWTSENLPNVTAVRVGTAPYHHAGATAAQDIAFAMATAVTYLRAMTDADMESLAAARQILFSVSLGTHHFLAIGKLRALRRLWSRVLQACGIPGEMVPMHIHARTSKRVLTQRAPYTNLLRNTAAVFAAAMGGADIITSVPFDAAMGLPSTFSRRIARNTTHILQDESHLNRVIDPPGGSWYLERLTDELAKKAWGIFQEIEKLGGMLEAIQSGWINGQIDSAFAPRAKDIASRKDAITGVSEFPNVLEERIEFEEPDRDALVSKACERVANQRIQRMPKIRGTGSLTAAMVDAATGGATLGQISQGVDFEFGSTIIPPLAPHPFAAPFEELRMASDLWQEEHGHRPRVFLANLGPIAHHSARAAYSRGFFEAGGFDVITNEGFADSESAADAFAESGSRIAVICSSDKLYPEHVPSAAQRLKSVGARTVVLAGNPGENRSTWTAAGVDRYIFIKCDVLATLRELLHEEGVLKS